METASLAFAIFKTIGQVLIVIGVLIQALERRKKSRCIEMTQGTVEGYGVRNNAVVPVVCYEVNGRMYQIKRHCRAVITVQKPSLDPQAEIWMDENDVLHIHGGAMIDLGTWVRQTWPSGMQVPVYYDPVDPQKAYAQRIPKKSSLIGWVFVWTGLGFVIFGYLIHLVHFIQSFY